MPCNNKRNLLFQHPFVLFIPELLSNAKFHIQKPGCIRLWRCRHRSGDWESEYLVESLANRRMRYLIFSPTPATPRPSPSLKAGQQGPLERL